LENLYKQNGAWHIRFRENDHRRSKRLGSCADFPRESDIAPAYYAFLAKQTSAPPSITSAQTLRDFVLRDFFAYIERTKKASTTKSYKQLWRAYLDTPLGHIKLSEFSRADARRTLEKLQEDYSPNLVQNAKIVLGSLFSRALDLDLVKANPIDRMKLESPRSVQTDGLDGPRYTNVEIQRVLAHLKGRDRALIAVFFYAALRPGEVAALSWEDYDGLTLNIHQAVWDGKLDTPKTKGSAARVPVIEPLRQILAEYKPTTAGMSWMFPGATGNPIRLNRHAQRVMKPAFKKLGIEWRGWYALRRGATDYLLLDMQLEFDEVRTILRHDPRSKVLEKHYAAEAARRGVQQRTALAVGRKIDTAFAAREAEQMAKLAAMPVN